MKPQEAALRAFIEAKLAEQGLQADETVWRALRAVVSVEPGAPNESEETRAIRIKEDTDGKVSAKSIKLFNLMQVSWHDLWGFLLKEMTILLTEDNRLKVALSLLNLLHEFYPKLGYDFNEQDARILLTICELGRKEFAAAEIEASFAGRFGQPLAPEQLQRSLSFLEKLRVLRYLGEGRYLLREKVTYERN